MSNQFLPQTTLFENLKDKVVVLNGGASGIGASTVRLLHSHGASVVFSDLNTTLAESLVSSLSNPPNLHFLTLDASSYTDTITLFRTARQKYGNVDHAIACAGILERPGFFDPNVTVEELEQQERSGAEAPSTAVIDVNLKGTAYFLKVAAVYLKEGTGDRSITLLSSAAGFRESPGLPIYQSSKHGVLGLVRSLRKILFARDGIRLNAVCPSVTDTAMANHIATIFAANGLGTNTAEDVALFNLGVLTADSTANYERYPDGMNGKALYIEQGLAWEFEDGYWDTMPMWLGEAPTERLRRGLEIVGMVSRFLISIFFPIPALPWLLYLLHAIPWKLTNVLGRLLDAEEKLNLVPHYP